MTTSCGPERTTQVDQRPPTYEPYRTPGGSIATGPVVRTTPIRSNRVRVAAMPLGAVPYDLDTLPLVSPDGRWIATQTGVPPTWDSALARADSPVPYASRIEVYRIGWDENTETVMAHAISEPLILGRSADAQGFLVESVRPDGSRWIGKVSWSTGNIEWLVQNSAINAFATLGPQGQLAWSRRQNSDAESNFDLVIQTASGTEWFLPGDGGSWLMPGWGGRGDSLFVLHLKNGFLDAVHAVATDDVTFRQSARRMLLATDATDRHAYTSILTHQMHPLHPDALVFMHPAARRVAVWRPHGTSGQNSTVAMPGSIAGVLDAVGHLLVAVESRGRFELHRHPIGSANEHQPIMTGLLIPRLIHHGEWSHLLMSPGESGLVGLTALQMLPVDEDSQASAR